MAEPLTTAAALIGAGAVTGAVTDWAGNMIQTAGVVADWAKAQEGLRYTPCNFVFQPEPKTSDPKQPTAERTKTELEKTAQLEAEKIIAEVARQIPLGLMKPVLSIEIVGATVADLGGGKARFGVALRRGPNRARFEGGQTVLAHSAGFDSAVGSQLEIAFSGVDWPGGYLLTFYGQVNPFGGGFSRFEGAVLMRSDGGTVPQGFAVHGSDWDRALRNPAERWGKTGYRLNLSAA